MGSSEKTLATFPDESLKRSTLFNTNLNVSQSLCYTFYAQETDLHVNNRNRITII